MSNHSDSSKLLDVDKIFLWFTTIYGSQKMLTSWEGVPERERAAVWTRALSKFPPSAVYAAMNGLADGGPTWPPTLPEFVALVREAMPRPEHQRALPPPERRAEDVALGAVLARKVVEQIVDTTSADPARWAYALLERVDRKESVPAVGVTFALQALRNLGRNPPEHWADRFSRVRRAAA
jgi:hypothetical protein